MSKLGINTLRLQSGQKGEFSGIQSQRRLRCGGTAESSDKEKQSDKAWTAHVGKPWEGVQVVRYAAGTSNEVKFQEWILLM